MSARRSGATSQPDNVTGVGPLTGDHEPPTPPGVPVSDIEVCPECTAPLGRHFAECPRIPPRLVETTTIGKLIAHHGGFTISHTEAPPIVALLMKHANHEPVQVYSNGDLVVHGEYHVGGHDDDVHTRCDQCYGRETP